MVKRYDEDGYMIYSALCMTFCHGTPRHDGIILSPTCDPHDWLFLPHLASDDSNMFGFITVILLGCTVAQRMAKDQHPRQP